MYYKAKLLYRAIESTGIGKIDHEAIINALDGLPDGVHEADVAIVVYAVYPGDLIECQHVVYVTTLLKYRIDTE